jgi:hypothetical protein
MHPAAPRPRILVPPLLLRALQESPAHPMKDSLLGPPLGARAAPAQQREPFFDNAKGMTVFVVILSHTLMAYVDITAIPALSCCTVMGALVAMPAFSLLSGHLSSTHLTPRRMVSIVKMLATFVLYQTLYFLAGQLVANFDSGAHIEMSSSKHKTLVLPLPVWGASNVSWFLLCLVVWRTVLPVFARLRRPLAVALFLCCLASFLDEGSNFMPIFGFFPFFLIGHTYSRQDIWAVHRRRNRVLFAVGWLVLLLLGIAAGPMDQLGGSKKQDGSDGSAGAADDGDPLGGSGLVQLLFAVPMVATFGGFSCLYDDSAAGGDQDHRRFLQKSDPADLPHIGPFPLGERAALYESATRPHYGRRVS